ncbi:MAG: precorrin-6A reductase [Desulfobacterales bacterium]|nr:precorrin-6A reductase [Desulfobacterales bacterium]
MILLIGGTTEAVPIARALLKVGFNVLLSTATEMPPRGRLPARLLRRTGMLNAEGLAELICTRGICAVVDATHPYAAATSVNAWHACRQTGIPYVAFDRPSTIGASFDGIFRAENHAEAAALACSFRHPVLLTIGVRNLSPYVSAARQQGIPLVARVLNHPSSLAECRRAGLTTEEIVCANGPFSVTENASLIMRHHIGVLVTKDSGDAGGVRTKIIAAQTSKCRVVVIRRPARPQAGYPSIAALLKAIQTIFPGC